MQNVPNTVPNGSGRKAKLSDDELTSIVLSLTHQNGEAPTLDSIIEAAGGCQRSRAVAARKNARMALANESLESHLHLSPAIEVRHRSLLAEWLSLSRKQLQPVLDSIVEETQKQVSAAELSAQDARTRLEHLERRQSEAAESLAAANARIQVLNDTTSELTNSVAHWKAIASERGNVIRQLTEWPGKEHATG